MKRERLSYKMVLSEDRGSAIVIAILTLLVVTIIGLSTIDNSTTEKTIATNDILYKQAFSAADGGTQVAQELIEQNIACPKGFFPDETLSTTAGDGNAPLLLTNGLNSSDKVNRVTSLTAAYLAVVDNDFATDGYVPVEDTSDPYPSDTEGRRDIYFVANPPLSDDDAVPHTNIVPAEHDATFIDGNSMLMAEGYSGFGKGAGFGGGKIIYDINSKNEYSARNSCTHIIVEYRHLIGKEGDCEYK